MKVKLLLFGEQLTIPYTSIGLGLGLLSVWMNNRGFTSSNNSLGAMGYIFLETRNVEIGDLDGETNEIFSNLHGRNVNFTVACSTFARNGGVARISMAVSVQEAGQLRDKKIEFLAEDCTGISLVSSTLSFSTTMFQLENELAELTEQSVVSEEDVMAIADSAPPEPGGVPV